ncbi:MAG: hypothetical protein H6815_12365 [Phycisphaeraceae bacterium]|nr:hypothetical protein [Phycisphaerales bacterium]MCB9861234.1 hypothetical protein [Phycisphaeraceae bacterium]
MTQPEVSMYASVETVSVRVDEPAMFRVQMHIDEGAPIYAADPGEGGEMLGIIPLRVHVLRGSHISVFADYPDGKPHPDVPSDAPEVRVCSGSLKFDVAIEQTAQSSEPATLGITYQHFGLSVAQGYENADERELYHNPLFAPKTVELDIDIRCG